MIAAGLLRQFLMHSDLSRGSPRKPSTTLLFTKKIGNASV